MLRPLLRSVLAAFWLAALLPCSPAAAQGRAPEPRRPRLAATADTNSAGAYYAHGVEILRLRPMEAANAFYWATRLEPGWADAWYARRVALFMSRPERISGYMDGNRRIIESREMRSIDSLHLRALTLNPFVRTKFDKQAFEYYVHWSVRRDNPRANINPAEVQFWLDTYFQSAGPYTRAWVEYAEGRFPEALRAYASALRGSRNKAGIHADRARIFLLIGRPDSALAEMNRAVERMRERDDRDLVFLYESKALFEHSAGIILEQQGNVQGAREAYGRALQEDLSYYPAHLALAAVAQRAGDTATALAEMDLAVQIREDEPNLRYAYGQVLAFSRRFDEAEAQLRRAVEIEPYYAAPYALLGGVLESQGKGAEALQHYREFLARASRNHPLLPGVRNRIAAFGGETAP